MDTKPYEERLLEEAKKLDAELAEVGRRNPSNPGDWEARPQETGLEADQNVAADHQEGYGDNAAILNDLEKRSGEVAAALARIRAGTYSVCTVCGERIESERLDADPAAATCLSHLSA